MLDETMNVDIGAEFQAGPDRLAQMFIQQSQLQNRTYGFDLQTLPNDERIQYIKDSILAATDELHEALGEVGWKHWATDRQIKHNAYFAELVDLWHFVMNLMLATGSSPEVTATRLYHGYEQKRQINEQRQVNGYDGVTGKCPYCKRALDDPAVKCSPPPSHGPNSGWCETGQFKVHASLY